MQSSSEQPEEGIWFERLVDGELNQEEYHRLVSSLDERPAGWKQCALAFLEAQALSRELRGFEHDGGLGGADARPPAGEQVELASAAKPDTGHSDAKVSPWGIAGIAASFLLTLGVGLWMSNRPEGSGGPATRASFGLGMGLIPKMQASARPAFELCGSECNRHVMNRVTLVVEGKDDQGESKEQLIDLPVVGEDESEPYLTQSAMPPDVQEALQRSGHRVERRRQYYPVRLRDGRQMVLPIEEVEIVPVKQTYQ